MESKAVFSFVAQLSNEKTQKLFRWCFSTSKVHNNRISHLDRTKRVNGNEEIAPGPNTSGLSITTPTIIITVVDEGFGFPY